MTDAAMAMPTRRVDMWYGGTAPQGRLSVGFRIILAIPQLIVLYFLFIALFVVVVIGWFAALFTGRLPDWAHSFISGVVRWSTRVGAYLLLLTDRYPPFSLDDEDYPARPILPDPGPLNRWAVLFRIILFVPAAVFVQIVQYGLTVPLLLAMWFVVLITGSMPPTLYLAYAALLRYETRFHSWFSMLTSEYPWGMLGDRVHGRAAPFGPTALSLPAGSAPDTDGCRRDPAVVRADAGTGADADAGTAVAPTRRPRARQTAGCRNSRLPRCLPRSPPLPAHPPRRRDGLHPCPRHLRRASAPCRRRRRGSEPRCHHLPVGSCRRGGHSSWRARPEAG